MSGPPDPGAVLDRAKVLVCVGAGGVGKTTTSAAVAMEAARRGRRVIVLTIDPARRLASALGLPEIGNAERVVSSESFTRLGLEAPAGVLSAMMLDVKTSWDEVVMKYHPEPEAKQRLLENRLYFTLSTALAGSQEYMAMEKLYDLSTRREDPLDLIVLDTPPASHAVDFLDAPSKLLAALDNDATRWLLEPYSAAGRVTSRLFDAGSSFVIRTLGRLTGAATLEELAELLSHFQGMYEGFRQRAKAVRVILSAPTTSFWVVAAPHPAPIETAQSFFDRLQTDGIPVGAFVLNRAEPDPFARVAAAPELLRAKVRSLGGDAALADRWLAVAEAAHRQSNLEQARARALAREVSPEGQRPVLLVPDLGDDIHDLAGLEALRAALFGAPVLTG